jgi:hypothetical protein
MRNLGKRDRDIFGLPTVNERAHVRPDGEAAVAISRPPLDPKRLQTRCKEIKCGVGLRRSRASTSVNGVAQAVPTNTRWPGLTTSTAASADRSLFEICSRDDPKSRNAACLNVVSYKFSGAHSACEQERPRLATKWQGLLPASAASNTNEEPVGGMSLARPRRDRPPPRR